MDEEKQGTGGRTSKEIVVEKALRELSVFGSREKELRTAMVGDRCFDIQGAVSNGVVPVGVTFGYGTRQELEDAGASLIGSNAMELGSILLS
jgi:phosphoglycolate phosphatase